jgi:hypothetical protein
LPQRHALSPARQLSCLFVLLLPLLMMLLLLLLLRASGGAIISAATGSWQPAHWQDGLHILPVLTGRLGGGTSAALLLTAALTEAHPAKQRIVCGGNVGCHACVLVCGHLQLQLQLLAVAAVVGCCRAHTRSSSTASIERLRVFFDHHRRRSRKATTCCGTALLLLLAAIASGVCGPRLEHAVKGSQAPQARQAALGHHAEREACRRPAALRLAHAVQHAVQLAAALGPQRARL